MISIGDVCRKKVWKVGFCGRWKCEEERVGHSISKWEMNGKIELLFLFEKYNLDKFFSTPQKNKKNKHVPSTNRKLCDHPH